MEDLLGLESTAPSTTNPPSRISSPNYYPTLQPTPPISGRSTPSLQPGNALPKPPPSKGSNASPASDSFAKLVNFGGVKPSKSLSLQEQQRAAQEARLKQAEERSKAFDRHFGQSKGQDWDILESGTSTPSTTASPAGFVLSQPNGGKQQTEPNTKHGSTIPQPPQVVAQHDHSQQGNSLEDLLRLTPRPSDSQSPASGPEISVSPQAHTIEGDDDGVFGLGASGGVQQSKPTSVVPAASVEENDDFLGDLARPVSEFSAKSGVREATRDERVKGEVPEDRPLAELVDMGFPIAKAKEALLQTESGTDVQAAVGWLLNRSHEESKSKRPRQETQGSLREESTGSSEVKTARSRSTKPAWMEDQVLSKNSDARKTSRSPMNGETDAAKVAAEIGSNLFRTANSLWKTGTTKLNKAVAEFNNESDAGQPKWMKSASVEAPIRETRPEEPSHTSRRCDEAAAEASVTDEALMLESGDSRPPLRGGSRQTAKPSTLTRSSQRTETPMSRETVPEPDLSRPKFLQQIQSNDPKSRIQRRNFEEQSAQAYVSPARRRKPTPKPPSPEPDLLFDSSRKHSLPARQAATSKPSPEPISDSPQPRSLTSRTPSSNPPVRSRSIPSVSPAALNAYTKSRQAGNAAVKRGDYADATNHYTSALPSIPAEHPLRVIVLTNRALTRSKTGEPKAAISDAEAALQLIGDSKGIGEKIDSGEDGIKDMNTFWGKAMTRKAEALEQLEKWSDASVVWKTCVEAGVGGATSIAGRTRCERAANSAPTSVPRTAAKRPLQKSTPRTPSTTTTAAPIDTVAVSRLRAANTEAERVDDEKFRLADAVSDRVSSWRKGKEGNLRALLASLENVLWEGAGWKKVGMGELILANKVKIVYMKGIAKVHPDKVACSCLVVWDCDERK